MGAAGPAPDAPIATVKRAECSGQRVNPHPSPRVKRCTSVPSAEPPHAHTSPVPEGAITPSSVLSPVPVFGLVTTLQRVPSQCIQTVLRTGIEPLWSSS